MFVSRSTSFPCLSAKNTIRRGLNFPACSSVALVLVSASVGLADVYFFECDSLPTSAGWTQINAFCGAQEWSEDGLLYQEVPLCEEFPGFGAQFDYTRDIENLEGVSSWFAEWRVVTTGISEELIYTAPAHLVLFDGNGLLYHFSIADDRVRFIRQLGVNPVLYFDIQPLVPHTFRVELSGPELGDTFVVYIDGEIVDSGEAEGPFFNPPWQPGVNFRAKSKFVPSVSTWSHIRWGELQKPGSADFTLNGEVDFDDLPFFQECLMTEAGNWAGCRWADMDFDGDVDCTDWELFLAAWTDPADPPCTPTCGDCDPADFNFDGSVGAFDLAILLGSWGPCPEPPANCPADLDVDGLVNAFDLAMLLGSWG